MLPQQTHDHDKRKSDFPPKFLLLENSLKIYFSIFAVILHFLPFFFIVNNGHRAIKVHVNEVQYCRAGHIYMPCLLCVCVCMCTLYEE